MKATLRVYYDEAREWRWQLRLGNGRVIADSGEGYVTRAGATAAAKRLAKWATAAVVDVAA